MQVRVNGETHQLTDGTTLADLVARFELSPKRIAVEVNKNLVPRDTYDRTVIKDGDNVEIVTLVGGG
jgi:sulfur carrier protein